ncbi:MAG: AMP-binding protein [Deltaproteobacteria bacterium]|nr:AMP-binding protein [Deltaproteobacteria bacterium]
MTYRRAAVEAHYRATGLWTSETLVDRVRAHAQKHPDAPAIVDGSDDSRTTYGELWREARRFAAFLRARGVQPGDGVSVQLPNRRATAIADLGVLAAGAVLNPLLPGYRTHELRHILAASRARVWVTPEEDRGFDHLGMARALRAELPALHTHVVVGAADAPPSAGSPRATGAGSARDGEFRLDTVLAATAPDETALPALDAAAVCELIFTSGTESTPKAILHSEETANRSVRAAIEAMTLAAGDVVFMPSPVGHSTGLNFGLRLALYAGLPIVLQDRWDARRAAELIERERCSYTLAATTFLGDLVRSLGEAPRDVSSMRCFGCGGAPVPPELVVAADAKGIRVLRIYGSTEGLVLTWNRPGTPLERRARTDGPPLPHVELEIRDEEDRPVTAGVAGEIHVRGPSLCVGFFDDPERMARSFTPDGWLRSGDLGVVDDAGHLTIVGRKKEIIIRGGMNIAPREIEDLLCEMPGVRTAAVIGLPDERLGEVVCACLVVDPAGDEAAAAAAAADAGAAAASNATVRPITLDDVTRFLRGRELATYKLPQALRLVAAIPTTASGKLRKAALRDAILAEDSAGKERT